MSPSRTALGTGTPRLSWSLTATASGPRSWWHCDGTTSTSPPGACMYAGPKSGDASVHPIGAGKPRAAQAPARSPNVPIRLHLGASRTVVRSRISAHGLPGRSIPKRKGTGTMAGPPKIRLAFGNNRRRRRSFALAVRCSVGLCRGRDAKESHRHCRQ
jgi:hypothetical protein